MHEELRRQGRSPGQALVVLTVKELAPLVFVLAGTACAQKLVGFQDGRPFEDGLCSDLLLASAACERNRGVAI